jgi:hypothetical protein
MRGSIEAVRKQQRSAIQKDDWKPWNILPGPQTQAAETEAFETLFGGRAGGGKSGLLLALATLQHRNSIIFRRVYPNLKEMIQKSEEMLEGSGASYNGTDKLWRGMPGDRTLEFGAVQYTASVSNYRGRPHDFKAFDEITEFTEYQLEFISGWTRTHIRGQRCRVICTCNPPTEREGTWVKARWAPWIDPSYKGIKAEPGELRWFARVPSIIDGQALTIDEVLPTLPPGSLVLRKIPHADQYEIECPPGPFTFDNGSEIEDVEPISRTFIPATLADNPFIDASYKRTLMALPEPLRSQLLYGDFSIDVEGNASEWQLIPLKWVRLAQERWTPHPPCHQSALGVDVARGGADNTAIVSRHHTWFGRIQIHPGGSVPSSADSAAHAQQAVLTNDIPIYVDTVGVGAGTYDFLIEWGMNAYSCIAGGKATRLDRNEVLSFVNLRSQWAWNLREIFDPDNSYFPSIPPDDKELEEELIMPQWRSRGGKIWVEGREELMKPDRLGRSPDRLSSMLLAASDFDE